VGVIILNFINHPTVILAQGWINLELYGIIQCLIYFAKSWVDENAISKDNTLDVVQGTSCYKLARWFNQIKYS